MGIVRLIALWVLLVTGLLGLAGGAVAMVGLARWGAAGWYYRYDPAYRLRCGQEALRKGDIDRAREVALILEADGNKDHASLLRGEELFLEAKPYAEANKPAVAGPLLYKALGELFKIRDKGALLFEASVIIGKCHLYLHQHHEAESAFLFALGQDENNIDAHRGLASIYFDQGAMMRAILHLEKVAELDQRDGRPNRLIALIYKEQDQLDPAVENYEKALERDLPVRVAEQNAAHVRKELVECLVKRSLYNRALAVLEEFSPLPEDAAAVEELRAECLVGMGKPAEAQVLLDNALELYKDNVDLYRLRAKLHIEAKEYAQAVTLLEQALKVDRHDYVSRYQLVVALRRLGRKEEADRHQRIHDEVLRDIQERDLLSREAMNKPWDASIRLKLARMWRKVDRPDIADMWERAAANCPPAPMKEPEKKLEKPRK